ncbi:tetratricopeptide repeat protein [Candidatus Dependentiae bacterium]|nr:tetratricopeptide repeat protein [Candidatus Dependentiae bacterium]
MKKALEITNRGIYIAALAQIHHDLDKIDDATSLMKKAIKIAPEIVENHFLLGLWYFETEENDRAREYFNYCIKADPSNVKYHIYLNRNLSKLMMFQDAINNLAKLDMQKEVLIELGKIYLLADRHDEAKNVYSEAVSLDPNCIEARDALGVMYFDIDKSFQSATSEFEQILMIDEGHQNANLYLGRLEYSKQPRNYKLAIKHWERVERIEDSKTKFAFGHSYFQMRNFSKALSTLLKLSAIEFNPDALLLLGKIYEELGDYKNAFNIYKKIIDKENKYQNAWYCLADLTDKLNQIDDSKDYYTYIITNIKKDPEIYKRLGELFIYHFANNKFSIEGFERYVELKYKDNITKIPPDLVRIISLVYLKEKDFQKSRNYAATLTKGKDFTEFILSINNYQMEDWELCYNHLSILSERYSAQKWFIPYQITLAEVQEYRGKYAEALKIYEQVLLLDPKLSEEIYFRFAHIIYNLIREVKRREWVHSIKEKKPKKIDNFIMDSIEEIIKLVQKSKLLKRTEKQFSSEETYLKILASYSLSIKDFSYAKKRYKILSKNDKFEVFGKIKLIQTEFLNKLDSNKGSKSKKKPDYTKYEKELLKVLKASPDNYDGVLLKYELKKQRNKQKAIQILRDAFFKINDPGKKMDILMRTVDELLKLGDNENSIQILKDVLTSAPKFIPAIIRLSKVYFNIKDYKEASKYIGKLPFILHLEDEFFIMKLVTNFNLNNYTQVLEQFVFTDFSMDMWLEDNPNYFIYVAYSLFKLGSILKAHEIVEKYKADNRNEDYYLYYPEMLQFKDDKSTANKLLLEGIKEFSNSIRIKKLYIDNLILMEKYHDAETFYNTFNDELKNDSEVLFSIAQLEEKLKDYSSTESMLINIQEKLKDPLKGEELLANVYIKTGDISNAIRLLESVRKKYVDRFDTVKETLIPHLYLFSKDPLSIERIKLFEKIKDLDYKLVELYQTHKEYDKFEDTVKSLIDRFPNDTALYYKIIKIRIEKLDEPQGTIDYINSILDFSPDAPEAKYYKAFIYSNILNETENALDLMKEVISKKEEVKYLILLGEIYLKMERTTDAVDMFSIVIEREPENFKIYKLLSEIEFNAENFDKSLELINKAIDMGLNKDEVLEQMANIYVNTNRYEEAIAVFEELLDKGIGEGNIHAQLGAAYLMLGNNVKAQQNLMHSIELDQSAGECFFKMGEIFLKQKKFVQSIKTLEKAKEKKFDDQNLHFYLGVAYHSIKKEDLAQREFEIALQDQRDDYFVHKYLGEIYFYQGKYEKAAIEYSRAREINPKKIEIYSFLARSYLETKEYQKVIELVDYVLKFEKQNIQLHIMKCSALFQLEKYEDAEKILTQVLKVDSNNQDALNLIGKIFFSRELHNESLRYFEKSLELNPNNFDALKYSGMINLHKFRLKLAEEQLYKAQYLFNADPDIPLLLGNIFMKESKWIDAIIQFRKAIKLNITNYEAFVGLGDIYQFKQRWPEAIQEYERVLTFNYYLPNIHYNLGRLYEKISMPDKAEQYYRQTIKMDPENYSAMEKLGLLLISQHRYNEALTFVINALTKEHDNVKIMIQLIDCYRNLDQLDQAKKILNQASELAPDDFDLIKAWGDYHLDLENLKDARKSYEALILKDPDYIPALLKLGHIYTGLKDYEKAEELYKKIIRMTATRKDIAFYGLGFLYEDQGDNENAIQWYLRAISENNNYLAPLLRLGNIYYNEGNFIRSIDYWENAIKQGVDETEVFYYLGNAYLKIEENIKALNIFEEGRKRSQDLQFNYGIVETYLSLKQYELALELLKNLKMKDKDESESLHLFMSKVYIHLNQPEKALIENYILFKKGVNQIDSMFQVAKIYINFLNRPQAGNYILEKLVKGEPDNLNFNTWLFESYRKLGNFEKAEDLLRKVNAFEEKSPELYVAIGKFHEDRGDKKLARDAYINALNINPHLEEIQDKLGNL